MAYEPPRLGLSPAQSWRQGLLDRARGGRNLLGPNLPPDGIPMGGRVSLIGPNPNALNATKGWTDSIAPRSTAVAPKVYSAGNRAVSDILRDVRMGEGSAPRAVGDILNDYGTPGSSNELGAITDTQGEYRTSPEVAYGGFAQNPTAFPIPGGFGEGGGPPAESGPSVPEGGPEDVLAPAQGFFGRLLGDRGSGKRSDIARAMMAAGGRMMEGNPWGTLATVGQGVEAGLGAYEELEGRRLLGDEREEEKRIQDEDRAAQKKVNDTIAEITSGWDETTTPEQKISDYQRAFNTAIGNGDHALAGRIREMTAYLSEGPEAGPAVRYETWDQTEGRSPDGTPTRVREVIAGEPGTISDRQYFDKDVYLEQIGEGVDAAEAARNSWRTGGIIVDPDKAKAAAAKAETRTGQEKLNAKLADAAYDGLMLMVVDPATVDPETGETIPGQPNYADYYMAGATPFRNPLTGAITAWEQGSPGTKEGWQSFLASLISNAGSETAGFGSKLLGFFGRSVFLKDNPEILAGYTNALNYINPTVRFLSGAQMTNQEAMRYYNALIPAPGDPIEVIELKRRKRDVLTNAMGGPGISNAARQKARKDLNLDEDELMVHEYGTFGDDASGRDAADYYLARLTRAIGVTDMTDYGAVSGQVDDTLYTDDDGDPGAFVRPPGGG